MHVLRVTNFQAVEDYSVVVTYKAHQALRTESYTLACTLDGAVRRTSQVVVERGVRRERSRRARHRRQSSSSPPPDAGGDAADR